MSPIRMSRIEVALRIVLEFFEAIKRHDWQAMKRLMSDDCILEGAGPAPDGTAYTGRESISRHYEAYFSESPGTKIEIEEVFGSGNRCVARWKYDASEAQEGQAGARGVDIFGVENGLIREIMSYVKG